MDISARWLILPLIGIAFALSALPGCTEGCGARLEILGQSDHVRAIDQVRRELKALGFEERKNVPTATDGRHVLDLQPPGAAYGYFARISAGESANSITVSLVVVGASRFPTSGFELFVRITQQLQGVFGRPVVKPDSQSSCGQSLV